MAVFWPLPYLFQKYVDIVHVEYITLIGRPEKKLKD